MKYRFLIIISLMVLAIVGCTKKFEYNIDLPDNSKFNSNSVSNLSDSDIKLIKEYIPMVIKWYNSVDITKPQSKDFVPAKIKENGDTLNKNDIYQNYFKNYGIEQSEGEEEKFKQINTVVGIVGQIAGVISTSEPSGNDSQILINEDIWRGLSDRIKESIEFYYN